jgi:tight adherence protein B
MSQILTPLIYVLAFLAVVLGVESASRIMFSARDQQRRVNRRLTLLASGMRPADVYSTLVRQPPTPFGSQGPLFEAYDAFGLYCRQAGIRMTPIRLLSIAAGAALVLWLVSMVVFRAATFSGVVAGGFVSLLASIALCGLGTFFWISRSRSKRMQMLEEQLPLALDVVNRALRAGHPVVSAVQLAANEMGDPIGSEFGLIVDETTYGYEFRDALTNFARRTGSPDAHFFAVSVGIQSETGGNLAEILEGLARVIRGRCTLTKRVRALSSEGRASAKLLSALPAFLITFMLVIRPTFYTSKFADPIFWPAVAIIGTLYLLGWYMIHRIINFKY